MDDLDDLDPALETLTTKLSIYGLKIGVSGILGYCTAYFTKSTLKKAAYYAGGMFLTLQILAAKGWIKFNWKKIGHDFSEGLQPDSKKNVLKQAAKIITYKLPKAAAFSAGFYYGWRYTGQHSIQN